MNLYATELHHYGSSFVPSTKENCPCGKRRFSVRSGVVCAGCDKAFPGCKCRQGRCRTSACIYSMQVVSVIRIFLHFDVHLHLDEIVGDLQCECQRYAIMVIVVARTFSIKLRMGFFTSTFKKVSSSMCTLVRFVSK